MENNDIGEFISKAIQDVKSGMPEGCALGGVFDFDISVTTEKKKGGKLDIRLVGIGRSSGSKQTQRMRFQIIDEESRDKNTNYVMNFLDEMASNLAKLDKRYGLRAGRHFRD
ncbi:MAG: hypothetical protein JW840_02570 [Candidatus Thermoplasmatota archaeon]|nr:hypothetical protein [Candidatus Thermoplasmatota archaeon]